MLRNSYGAVHSAIALEWSLTEAPKQQQVIFRNSASPGGAAWSFWQQFCNWRSHAPHTVLRTLPWAAFALIYLAVFGILSIFASAAITKSEGNDRLIRGPKGSCGYLSANYSDPALTQLLDKKTLNDSFTAAEYAKNCYGGNYNSLTCGTFPKPSLHYTVNQNASCPFQGGICKISDTAAFEMDTGLLDTHEDLGINAPPADRIKYRKMTTCAPLQTRSFGGGLLGRIVPFSQQNVTDKGIDGDYIVEYLYGPVAGTGIEPTFYLNNHSILDSTGYSVSWVSRETPVCLEWLLISKLGW